MRVDRAAFLAMTATLAGGACVTVPPRVVAPTIDVPAAVPSPSATEAPMPVASGAASSGGPEAPPGPASEGLVASDSWPAGEGGAAAAALPTCGHSVKRFDPSRKGCTDDVGSPGDCARMNATGNCNPFPFPREECRRWSGDYKPGVAARAVSCALRLTGLQVCDACYTYRCGYEALMSACMDPSAASDCLAIHRACPGARLDECMGYLSGMSPAGRAKMVACMSRHDECGWGLYSCSESL